MSVSMPSYAVQTFEQLLIAVVCRYAGRDAVGGIRGGARLGGWRGGEVWIVRLYFEVAAIFSLAAYKLWNVWVGAGTL